MGLDLIIREQTDFRTDEKGRNTWTTVQLANFRNCWTILEKFGLSNCTTVSFDESTFIKILEELKEELLNNDDENLRNEVEELEEFIKNEGIKSDQDGDRVFEVHAWW